MTIEEYIAEHGVTKCAPAHAKGNEAKQALRSHVRKTRKAWSDETGVTLGVGVVREEAA